MKIRVIETIQRTIEIDVPSNDPIIAQELALTGAADTQPADWDYTWTPLTRETAPA